MAAVKHVLGISVMVYCFTTGFGLICHVCTGTYKSNDVCDLGNKSKVFICDPNDIWVYRRVNYYTNRKIATDNLPPEAETKKESNMACLKVILGNKHNDVKEIHRYCTFKKFADADGCAISQWFAKNIRLAPGANTDEAHDFDITKTKLELEKPEQCSLCYTDQCNAITGLRPAFFIYPPLLLLILTIWKLFVQ